MKIISTKTKLRKYPIYIGSDVTKNAPELLRSNFSDADKIILVTNDKIIDILPDDSSFMNILKII